MRSIAVLLIAAGLCAAQASAQDKTGQRGPTPQEIASFNTFYRAGKPSQALPEPVFRVNRQTGQRGWTVEASVETAPSRGLAPLCRMTRDTFIHAPRAPLAQRWTRTASREYAWLDRAACGKPTRLVELLQRIPDAGLVPLIEQHGVLLLHARLLFSGNTSCAPYRALRYRLAAIDVSAPPHGREQLYGLVFQGEGASATVWIKQRGATLNAWDVACVAAAPAA